MYSLRKNKPNRIKSSQCIQENNFNTTLTPATRNIDKGKSFNRLIIKKILEKKIMVKIEMKIGTLFALILNRKG